MSEAVNIRVKAKRAEIIYREFLEDGSSQDVILLKVERDARVIVAADRSTPAPRVVTVVADDSITVRSG